MRSAFSKIFWGFILILFEIHFLVIDILPDPVGYLLISLGVAELIKQFPIAKKANNLAIILIVVSIPTLVLQQNTMNGTSWLSLWSVYGTILSILNIILVFFIFQLMMTIVREKGDNYLINRTSNTFKWYMVIMIAIEFFGSFVLNFSGREIMGVVIVSVIIGLITEIVFLVLLRRFMRIEDGRSYSNINGMLDTN